MTKAQKDRWGGALVLAFGLAVIVQGASYDIGSLTHMGPGFFPVAIGSILALTGAAIFISGGRSSPGEDVVARRAEWRGWLCILLSLVAFMVLGRFGGLVPASFAVVFVSALGDRENRLRDALALASIVTVLAVVVFWWLLEVPFPLFAWG